MIFVIFGAFFVSPTLADDSNTNSNPNSKIEAMSAPEFWAQVMGIPLEAGKDVDYVICGPNVCKPQNNEICMVKKKIRTDHITQLSVVGGHFLNGLIHELRGDGTVVTYDYKCAQGEEVAKYHKKGWKDAPEGGYVQRRKTRTGGIFAKSKTKETSCYKGNDQKEYCLLTKEKSEIITRATVSYNKSGTAFRRCARAGPSYRPRAYSG